MKILCYFESGVDEFRYRSELTGEKLGWATFSSERSFRPVHQIMMHPTDGPVIIVGMTVLEVAETDDVFADEFEAMDAYYAGEDTRKAGENTRKEQP